jgi:glycosyltransferase involved in cell wall biosynthesis
MPRVAEQTVSENPKISVAMITYNHEKFIAQAIESVLMQKTDFTVELIIGEDCSTDGTRRIVQEYAQKFPNVIRAILHERNVGVQRNLRATFDACQGDYIALLEGDDYWVDPYKLQKQTKFLETNRHYSMCGCKAQRILQASDGSYKDAGIYRPKISKPYYELKDFIEDMPMHTSTVLLRKNHLELPHWLNEIVGWDGCIFSILADKGPVGYLDEVTSNFRLHSGGIWTGRSPVERWREVQKIFELQNAHFGGKYLHVFRRREGQSLLYAVLYLLERGQSRQARIIYWESAPRLIRHMPVAFIGWGLWVYCYPGISTWYRFTKWVMIRTRLRRIMHSFRQFIHKARNL